MVLLLVAIAIVVLWNSPRAIDKAAAWARGWIEETHSPGFELCRHFFLRFFDSELISDVSQTKTVAGGALGILVSLCLMFGQAYYHKYRMLLELDSPEPYRHAVLGDALFLIALTMTGAALFTTLQWPALFPTLRDYLALASLPVRMSEIFAAKFLALVIVAMVVIAATALPPSILIPAMLAGRYSGGYVWQIPGIFFSSLAGGAFVFFTFVAVQGALLNLLPIRQFPRVSLALQGLLLAVLLGGLPFVFAIPRLFNGAMPEWAIYAPPFWFFGIDQIIFGSRAAEIVRLARVACAALPVSVACAIAAYLWSYRRHRVRVLESPSAESAAARAYWPAELTDRLMPCSRSLGVFGFITKSLARSRQHRLILIAFTAIAVALISEGFSTTILDGAATTESNRESAIAIPLALSLFLLAGLRYLFRLPMELRANWIFRITERGHASELAAGTDRFLLWWGVAPVAILTFPIEVSMLGLRSGVVVSLACLLLSLLLSELMQFSFEKIPFTSSYLPGRRPLIETVLKYASAAIAYVWGLSALLSLCSRILSFGFILMIALAMGWRGLRRARVASNPVLRFEFEESLEPAVQTLGIGRD
jgi:hypothetical protein